MPAQPVVPRRVAQVGTVDEAAARLHQAMYGCTMHAAGLLHAVDAILDAEHEQRFTLSDVTNAVTTRCTQRLAQLGDDNTPEVWRLKAMVRLCQRLGS